MRRGGALVLGGVVLGAAIVFASRPLGVVGLGLLARGVGLTGLVGTCEWAYRRAGVARAGSRDGG